MADKEEFDLMKLVREDECKLKVGQITEIYAGTLYMLVENTKFGRNIKENMSEDFLCFVKSLTHSFLATIYVNAAPTEQEKRKRLATLENAKQKAEAEFDMEMHQA